MKKQIRYLSAIAAFAFAFVLTACAKPIKTPYKYPDADRYAVGGTTLSDSVKQIDLHWDKGSVRILPSETGQLSFEEHSEKKVSESLQLHYLVDGDVLNIRYAACGTWDMSKTQKELIVYLPSGVQNLTVRTTAADVTVDGVPADDAMIKSVNGAVSVTNVTAKKVYAETVSGDIHVSLSTAPDDCSVKTISGGVDVTLPSLSNDLIVSTVSGDVHLHLPGDTTARLSYRTVSGELNSSRKFGDDGALIDVSTTSGNLTVGD